VSGSTLHINRFDHFMIEVGSTATTYEPYTGDTYTFPFGQTVYGGTLNVTTGVLTISVVKQHIDLSNYNYRTTSGYDRFSVELTNRSTTGSSRINKGNSVLATYNYVDTATSEHFYITPSVCVMFFVENTFRNGELDIIYPLETPQTIQLTPQEIKTLLGANNIYHDCNGDTDVTYRANGALYVEQHP